jgi:osmotically-inducible protein OsmY
MNALMRILAAAILAIGIGAAGACTAEFDPGDTVSKAIKDAMLDDDVNVDYDRDAKVVQLKGAVDSEMEKARAEQVAAEAVGTSGKVLNELTIKDGNPFSNPADDMDGKIRDRLDDMIDNDPALTDYQIDFDVNNGAVEITGKVGSAREKTLVTHLVRSVEGVKDVANALELDPALAKGKPRK